MAHLAQLAAAICVDSVERELNYAQAALRKRACRSVTVRLLTIVTKSRGDCGCCVVSTPLALLHTFVHDLAYDALHIHVFAHIARARHSFLPLHCNCIAAVGC